MLEKDADRKKRKVSTWTVEESRFSGGLAWSVAMTTRL